MLSNVEGISARRTGRHRTNTMVDDNAANAALRSRLKQKRDHFASPFAPEIGTKNVTIALDVI